MVSERNQIITIPLYKLPENYQDNLHVCVPPLYRYWNYVALIKFIEIWRMQGATMFYIYYVSVNKRTMDVLKIYEKMVNTTDGLLYHARFNWIFTSLNGTIYYPTDIFRKYIMHINGQYQKIKSQVPWQDWNLILVWKILSKKITKCTSKWRMYGCKAPYHLCWEALNDEDDWIFSHINVSSNYILL